MAYIRPIVKGDRERTMMHAEVAMELVDAINPLQYLEVTPDDLFCKFTYGDSSVKLDLSGIKKYIAAKIPIPDPPSDDGDYALTCNIASGVVSYAWTKLEDCP